MAHPKLTAAVNRSVLTVSAAALIAGPLAGAALAQTTDGTLDPVLDLTCEQARKTEDPALIEQFCPEEGETESPLSKSVDEVTKTTDDTVKQVNETVAPKQEDPEGGGSGPTGGGATDPVLKREPTKNSPAPGDTNTGTQVEGSGNNFRDVPKSREGGLTKARDARERRAAAQSSGAVSFNANGPFIPGMQSQSSLTLQPFAAPLVSVPPVYELPQIAQELFGTATGSAVESPQVAGAPGSTTATAASPYSPAGYSATSADPTGWLAATATGLIMLVGAAHALNGGRTPRRTRA